jgi:hypothetical protein
VTSATVGRVPAESAPSIPPFRLLAGRWYAALLVFEVLCYYALRFPDIYNFNRFAFWDWGSFLTSEYLLRHGARPILDFGWEYGLLTIWIQELWFKVLGLSPTGLITLSLACSVSVAIILSAIADIATEATGHLLVALCVPFIVAFATDPPHALEPVMLSLGLLAQCRRRRGYALAFATAAVFIKPSMGYLYGAVLLLWIVADLIKRRALTAGNLAKVLAPMALTAVVLGILLISRFGLIATTRSLLPTSGVEFYRAVGFGAVSIKRFLYFPGVRIGYYFGSAAVLWTCAGLYLVGTAALLTVQSLRARSFTVMSEIILTCAVLHVFFITMFFGSPSSWTYYAYILIIGVAASTERWSLAPSVVVIFCALAALIDLAQMRDAIFAWRGLDSSPITAGLYAPSVERKEWAEASSLANSHRPAILRSLGGAEVLFPWLGEPAVAFLLPGVATPGEIAREVARLKSAGMIIVPEIPAFRNEHVEAAQGSLFAAFSDARLVFDGELFRVYERQPKVR